ncbi:Rubredoxin [Pseudonocardia sp. Ae263_Ps1]|nr:Rubredoxin [Pseudonocardia sp. Ae263_Ps1]
MVLRTVRFRLRPGRGRSGQRHRARHPFEDIPDDWMCPICGASKSDFRELEPGEEFPGR